MNFNFAGYLSEKVLKILLKVKKIGMFYGKLKVEDNGFEPMASTLPV